MARRKMEAGIGNRDNCSGPSGHEAVRVGENGEAWVAGMCCGCFNAVMVTAGIASRRCGSRGRPEAFCAASTGTVYSWTVVRRSYPGIRVPFVSAIIDLADKLTLKGTLREVDPPTVHAGFPVPAARTRSVNGGALALTMPSTQAASKPVQSACGYKCPDSGGTASRAIGKERPDR